MSLNIVIPLLNDSVVDLSRGEFRRHFKSSRGWKVDATPMIFARGRSYRRVGPGLLFTRQHNIGGIWDGGERGVDLPSVQFETMAFSRLTRLPVFKPVTNNNGDTANEEIIPSVLLADPRNTYVSCTWVSYPACYKLRLSSFPHSGGERVEWRVLVRGFEVFAGLEAQSYHCWGRGALLECESCPFGTRVLVFHKRCGSVCWGEIDRGVII